MIKKFLIGLGFFLVLAVASRPLLVRYFSKQDEIDPETIVNEFDLEGENKILGENTTNKRIEVDLTNQRLYAYEDNRLVYDYLISSGLWNRTPTGTFKIWAKVRSQKMSGGSKELGTYYYLPNVPYVLFFYNDKVAKKIGYSIHGTYWHNNFGQPMSHGCINMRTDDVALIYNWADMNTPITIFGKYQYKKNL